MVPLIVILASAAAISVVFLGILLRLPLAKYFADLPNYRKVHQSVIPRLGGIGIVLTFLLLLSIAQAFDLWNPSNKFLYSITFVSLFLLVAGSLDDILSLGYKVKFLLQFLLSGVVVCVFRMHFEQVSLFGEMIPLGGFGLLLSMLWIIALMNAVNIIDGIDGLAASVALAGFAGIGALAYVNHAPNPLGVCLALSGATLGFLYYNLQRRRKVFLGDTGSQFLGATLGILTFRIHDLPSVNHSVAIPLLLVGYPVLDTAVAMTRRFLKVRNGHLGSRVSRMFLADNDHLHHRLVYMGLSHLQATFLLMLLASGFAASAIIIPRLSWQGELLLMAYLLVAVAFILNRLGFLQRGSAMRVMRAWVLGGTNPADARLVRQHVRYYDIFTIVEDSERGAGASRERARRAAASASFGLGEPSALKK